MKGLSYQHINSYQQKKKSSKKRKLPTPEE